MNEILKELTSFVPQIDFRAAGSDIGPHYFKKPFRRKTLSLLRVEAELLDYLKQPSTRKNFLCGSLKSFPNVRSCGWKDIALWNLLLHNKKSCL